METKSFSQQSQKAYIDSVLIHEEGSKLIETIKRWDCDEREIASAILESDSNYNKLQEKVDLFKELIIEKILDTLEDWQVDIIVTYIDLKEEQCEITKETADCIARDLVDASRLK